MNIGTASAIVMTLLFIKRYFKEIINTKDKQDSGLGALSVNHWSTFVFDISKGYCPGDALKLRKFNGFPSFWPESVFWCTQCNKLTFSCKMKHCFGNQKTQLL